MDDPLLEFWRTFGDWGFRCVIIGVVLEVVFSQIDGWVKKHRESIYPKWEPRLKRYENLAGWVLIIGLAFEYRGHQKETQILDTKNAALHEKAELAKERSDKIAKDNLVLQSNVAALKIELSKVRWPRSMLLLNGELPTLLSKIPPMEVFIFCEPNSHESQQTAFSMSGIFKRAGWNVIFDWPGAWSPEKLKKVTGNPAFNLQDDIENIQVNESLDGYGSIGMIGTDASGSYEQLKEGFLRLGISHVSTSLGGVFPTNRVILLIGKR